MTSEEKRIVQARLRDLMRRAEGITELAQRERRELSADESATFSQCLGEIDGLALRLGKPLNDYPTLEEKREALRPQGRPIEDGSDGGDGHEDRAGMGGPLQTGSWGELCARSGQPVDMGEWDSPGEFFSTVIRRLSDPRLETRAMGEVVAADGGFLLPSQLASRIMDTALESEVVRSRATVIPMASRTATFPLFDSYDRSGGQVAGISATWVAEHGTPSEQQPRVNVVNLEAKKFMVLVRLSTEILEDVSGLTAQLTASLGRAIGYHLDEAFLNGAGAATPQGVLKSPALIVVAKETGQSADTIEFENVQQMMSRLAPGSWNNSVWVCHPTCLPQLFALSLAVGTGGSVVNAVTRDGSGNLSLYGRPLLVSEKVPVLGDQGDIGLYDFSRYLIGMRADLRVDTSQHASFSSDEVLLKLRLRLDAKSMDGQAQLPKQGLSLSPFVTLAARA
jgi:HK97 family phage major capsid protein